MRTSRMIATGTLNSPQYYQKVKNLFGSSLIGYYPQHETSGIIVTDISGNNRHGTYIGGTLADASSPVGKPCPTYTTPIGGINLATSGIPAAFSGQEGGIFTTIKMKDLAQWTSAVSDTLLYFQVDAQNLFKLYRPANQKYIGINRTAGGTGVMAYAYLYPTEFVDILATWSISTGVLRIYLNGVCQYDVASRVAIATNFVGTPTTARLYAFNAVPTSLNLQGWASDAILFNRLITDAEALQLSKIVNPRLKTISFIGDSITANSNNFKFPQIIGNERGGGAWRRINHAVSGQRIADHLAAQVAACASDNADEIIIALGSNDDNAGNMATLQAKVEAGIIALKASNPHATIYYMNVLTRWTDVGGGTEVDKSNIRTAIAAACTAQSITCWDTYSTPWIAAADTADGLHPTEGLAGGQRKVADAMLLLLPAQ